MPDDRDLQRLRASMDAINQRLAGVLLERARLVREIGAWKRAHGAPAVDERREAAMLAEVLRGAPADGYPADELRTIWRAVFDASRRLVERAP